MKKNEIINEWLQRSRSNLARANQQNLPEEILYEDLCFDCQQAIEKALKGLLRFREIDIPKVHSIGKLLSVLEDDRLEIPDFVKEGVILTDYAVQTRYPGDYEPVMREEFLSVLNMTNKIFAWIISNITE
ncbi:MAG TPA: HEPN domain-containing protein [Candidatus Cloacimonadota bacterium]|nr:HEPN domain-containing protein [Candidatus Cloacimonadota bacterium]